MLVLTFQTGSEQLALDVRQVREVVPQIKLQPVACGPPWLAGVFIYRGQVVPVVDLQRLIGGGQSPSHLSTRIILVTHGPAGTDRLVGLLAAQVADIREMEPGVQAASRFASSGQADLGPILADGREIVHLVNLETLLPELHEQKLALDLKEQPA
jgi:chemotaxis-related protein WspB